MSYTNASIPEDDDIPEDYDSSSRMKTNNNKHDEVLIKDARYKRRNMTRMNSERRGFSACSVESNDSSCSSGMDMECVVPLTLDDICFRKNYYFDSSSEYGSYDPTEGGRFFSAEAVAVKRKAEGHAKPVSRGKSNWIKALGLIKDRGGDPWEKFHFEDFKEEKCIRKRYNSITSEWTEDECIIKVDSQPFAHGAMRECYRMKKLSNFAIKPNWSCDANNYVAKRYMDPNTANNTYFDDVKLQMDAKLWGEEFNRHNPPKKVDIFMMCVVELPDRPDKPLFHVEHYIDGDYIKYNSNSGFVEGQCRQTPQAFSHFTFERSGHEVIVVDVQGVGDLYTDPQIHTATESVYGDGNLGTKGMALFFNSHRCNSICQSLGLTQFDLSKSEGIKNTSRPGSSSSQTHVRLEEVVLCESPSASERADFRSGHSNFQERSGSSGSRSRDSQHSNDLSSPQLLEDPQAQPAVKIARTPRPSCVFKEVERRMLTNECDCDDNGDFEGYSILGQIHLDLAKYHECCRFDMDHMDKAAAIFHLRAAADCGNLQALVAFSQMLSGLHNDVLPSLNLPDVEEVMMGNLTDIGLDYTCAAAQQGDVPSMRYLAVAYDTGFNLGSGRNQSHIEALKWYGKAVDHGADKPYLMLARMAQILTIPNSEQMDANGAGELYNEAAVAAMEDMKGKLATKYYALAEEAWSLVEDPEEED